MELNDTNGNSISYFLYIQKFYEEYEQLQLEHSRLRQQLNDHVLLPKTNDSQYSNDNNNSQTAEDLRVELESEKTHNKSLKTEVGYLQTQIRKTQQRYSELMNIVKNDKEKHGKF